MAIAGSPWTFDPVTFSIHQCTWTWHWLIVFH